MCGADSNTTQPYGAPDGSSPRVRSRPHMTLPLLARKGIISACAEQTPASMAWRSERRDHLRVCGADVGRVVPDDSEEGSSPRVRSRRPKRRAPMAGRGVISACAEQTARSYRFRPAPRDHLRVCGADSVGRCCGPSWTWDHLRVCGADIERQFGRIQNRGSSPRVRSRLSEQR